MNSAMHTAVEGRTSINFTGRHPLHRWESGIVRSRLDLHTRVHSSGARWRGLLQARMPQHVASIDITHQHHMSQKANLGRAEQGSLVDLGASESKFEWSDLLSILSFWDGH